MKRIKVCRLMTGGTIDMKLNENGIYVVGEFETKEEFEKRFPQLCDIAEIDVYPALTRPKDSSNITPHDWCVMAEKIGDILEKYDGIIITHGTDTMHFTAAALSFMLKNLYKPVILTGAQLPKYDFNSDAGKNLMDAILVATSRIPGVCIVFNSKVIKGTRARKVRIQGKDAFESFNFPLIGVIEGGMVKITVLEPVPTTKMIVDANINDRVALIKVYPGMNPEIIDFYVEKRYRGIIIEGFGAGHANVEAERYSVLKSIENAVQRGIPVFMCSQCFEGRVEMRYDVGAKLAKVGVVGLGDMLPEVALVKLMYVTAHEKKPDRITELMLTNMAGEITPPVLKRCVECGAALPIEARYCHHCGKKQEN